MRRGNKDRVVEHKGSVGRAGVFSLATSVRPASSVVGQTSACVRRLSDALESGQKRVPKGVSELLYVLGLDMRLESLYSVTVVAYCGDSQG